MDPARLGAARIRAARTPEDLERAAAFLRTPRVHEIVRGHPEERGSVRICEEGGEILAAVLLDPSPLRVRGVRVRCARILETGGEDGRLLFRSTGRRDLFGLMLEELLGYLWGRGYPCAFVHGELALYPAYGFVPCFYHPRVYVDVEAALRLPAPCRIRRFKSEDAPAVIAIRERFPDGRPVVFATGVPPFHHFSVIGADRQVLGYFSLEISRDSRWNPAFFAPEVEVRDRAAASTVLRHAAEKAKEAGLPEIHFAVGPGHPLTSLCLEIGGRLVVLGASSDPLRDEEMVHVSDPARLVEELAPWFDRLEPGAPATVPVATERAAWLLRADGRRVKLSRLEQAPAGAIEVPAWAWTQLLVGYRGVDELPNPAPPEHEETLRRLFPKTWPHSVSDPDLWEDLSPPIPYSDEGAAAAGTTLLPWTAKPAARS